MGKKWIAGAVKRPGAFTAKAEKAGSGVHAYAEKEKGAPGRTGKQARLALTFEKMRHKSGGRVGGGAAKHSAGSVKRGHE